MVNLCHVVAPKDCELIKNSLSAYPINWHIQEEQLGTADAVNIVLPSLPENEKMLILYADTPLIEEKMLSDFMSMKESDLNILTVMLDNPFGYGRIVRDKQNKKIDEIIEELDAKGAEKEIKECNTGIIYSDIKLVKDMIALVDNKNAKNEYYLTDIFNFINEENTSIYQIENSNEIAGINTIDQLKEILVTSLNNSTCDKCPLDPLALMLSISIISKSIKLVSQLLCSCQ